MDLGTITNDVANTPSLVKWNRQNKLFQSGTISWYRLWRESGRWGALGLSSPCCNDRML